MICLREGLHPSIGVLLCYKGKIGAQGRILEDPNYVFEQFLTFFLTLYDFFQVLGVLPVENP